MLLRKYRPGEEVELWELFFHTIRTVNCKDYTWEQVCAWAPDELAPSQWRQRVELLDPYVCVHGGQIVGYADVQDDGYIDHFFVHHLWQGQGIGKRLLRAIEAEARQQRLCQLATHASITARPFFESQGFCVIAAQKVTLGQIVLDNFKMTKRLGVVE